MCDDRGRMTNWDGFEGGGEDGVFFCSKGRDVCVRACVAMRNRGDSERGK